MSTRLKFGLRVLRDSCALAIGLILLLTMLSDSFSFVDLRDLFVDVVIYGAIIMATAETVLRRVAPRMAHHPPHVQWTMFVVTIVATTGAASLVGSVAVKALNLEQDLTFWRLVSISFEMSTFIALIIGVSEVHFKHLQGQLKEARLEIQATELERERALKLASEARLSALEARVHPHFLFNTLNSISSLIPKDPGRAERLIERMAALLRFSLETHQNGLVELEREMQIVHDYLEIEQARLGDRLRYRLDPGAGLESMQLPPFAIQTLVENSIKHAITPQRAGGEIRVRAARNNGSLQVEVADTGSRPFSIESAPAGHGLDNLRDRLRVLFGDAAELRTTRDGGWTTVRLKVPA